MKTSQGYHGLGYHSGLGDVFATNSEISPCENAARRGTRRVTRGWCAKGGRYARHGVRHELTRELEGVDSVVAAKLANALSPSTGWSPPVAAPVEFFQKEEIIA
eukprot:scaffold129351_cov30-Phaeocystis_antarctica.AAC.1